MNSLPAVAVTGLAQQASQISATNDGDAIDEWLSSVASNPHTRRAYAREAKRLLAWLTHAARGLPLSAMTRNDWANYQSWLASPDLEKSWASALFRSGLSPDNQRYSLIIMDGMVGWMVEAGYLRANPLALIRLRRSRRRGTGIQQERYLPEPVWGFLKSWLDHRVDDANQAFALSPKASNRLARILVHRRRAMVFLLYGCAPREFELAKARSRDMIAQRHSTGATRWWWEIEGKGGAVERVPVPDWVVSAWMDYRRSMGWLPFPSKTEASPLIAGQDCGYDKCLTGRQIYNLAKQAFCGAAEAAKNAGQPADFHDLLTSASPHWLRHSRISHIVNRSGDLRAGQAIARHRSVTTTEIYLHNENNHLWEISNS